MFNLDALQRLAGNRAVANSLSRPAREAVAVQRQTGHRRRASVGGESSPRAAADVTQLRTSTERTVRKLDGLRDDLRQLGERYEAILGTYDQAYDAFSNTLADAQEEAENTEFFLDLALDIALAVLPVIGQELRVATRRLNTIAPRSTLAEEAGLIEALSTGSGTEVARTDVRELLGDAEFGFGTGEMQRGSSAERAIQPAGDYLVGRAEGAAVGAVTERPTLPGAPSEAGGGFGGRTGDARASLEHLLLGLTRETLELHGQFTGAVPSLLDAVTRGGNGGDVERLTGQLAAIDRLVDRASERVRFLARKAQGVQQVRTRWVWERYLWVLWISRLSSWPWTLTPDVLAQRLADIGVLGPNSMRGEPGMLGYDPESVFSPVDRAMILQRARGAAQSVARRMSIAE